MSESSIKKHNFISVDTWPIHSQAQIKMVVQAFACCSMLHLLILFVVEQIFVSTADLNVALNFAFANIARQFSFNPTLHLFNQAILASDLVKTLPARIATIHTANTIVASVMVTSIPCYLFALPLLLWWLKKKVEAASDTDHIKGLRLISEKDLAKQCQKEKGFLPFGSVILPEVYEREHILIVGKCRTGKTVCLAQQLEAIRNEGHPAIVNDPRGDYIAKFYRPGIDFIFNPLDERTAKWNLFDDIHTLPDVSAIVESMIPLGVGGLPPFWNVAAQGVLQGVIEGLFLKGEPWKNHESLWKALLSSPTEIADLCLSCDEGKAGYIYLKDDKVSTNLLAFLREYLAWLGLTTGSGFSVQTWLDNPGDSCIFLTGDYVQQDVLRPYQSLMIDLLGKRFLSLPDDKDRKLFFCLDEFSNLAKLPILVRLLAYGGSKGASVILVFQDFGAVEHIYGKAALTILNSCGSSLVLKLSDETTAKIFSGRFGEQEYWYTSECSMDGGEYGYGLIRQKRIDPLILPSEIQELQKLTGYLLIPEHNPARVQLQIQKVNN